MPNFFYIDPNGQKRGPIDDQQLQALAAQGIIAPESQLETESGYKGLSEFLEEEDGIGSLAAFIDQTYR